jgi:hypothetical protein
VGEGAAGEVTVSEVADHQVVSYVLRTKRYAELGALIRMQPTPIVRT